jgi:hypothetical protein
LGRQRWRVVDLDDFSRSFAVPLFAAVPDLREHARAENGVLLVELQPGRARPDCTFWISTDDEEITVGFGFFHMHFDWPVRNPSAESDPIRFIQTVMSDEALIEDWTLNGKWSGSQVLAVGEEPDTSGLEAGHVVYIRSWSGARDRTIRGR